MSNTLTDAQIHAIKRKFANALAETLYPEDKDFREFLESELVKIATEDEGITKFVTGLGNEVHKLSEKMKSGGETVAGLTQFILQGIELDAETEDKEYSNYLLLVDATASLNDTKLTTSGTTPTSVDVSKRLNVLHAKGDSPFALLWVNKMQAIILVGGSVEAAGIVTFRDNGLYDIMYTNSELVKVHALLGVMATEDVATFKIAQLNTPKEKYDASALTLEVFKTLDYSSSDIYTQVIANGGSTAEATLAAAVEGWANSRNIDLDKYALHIPELDAIREYIETQLEELSKTKFDINTEGEIEDAVFEDLTPAAKVDEQSGLKMRTVTTRKGRTITYPKRTDDDTILTAVYKGIDNLVVEDARLLNIANSTENNPRTTFSNLVVSRVNALTPLNDSDKKLASEVANEVFGALLPHLDEIQAEYNLSLKSSLIESTPEKVQAIANDNRLHARGLSALSEEQQQAIYESIAKRPSLSEIEVEYDDEYAEVVLDILNQIAPYEYNPEILVDGVLKNQLTLNIDEDGQAYHGPYIRNVLLEVFTKLSSKVVNVDGGLIRELGGTGSSSSLFAMDSDTLKGLAEGLNEPRTYVVSGESVVMLVNRQVQEDTAEEVEERVVSLYSVVNKSHANNIVIVKTKPVGKDARYSLSSTTTFSGVADIPEYVKSVLI